jgi:hypothetical protein
LISSFRFSFFLFDFELVLPINNKAKFISKGWSVIYEKVKEIEEQRSLFSKFFFVI